MRQRVAVAAVSVLIGFVALSPALAKGDDDDDRKGKGGKGTTSTTAPSMADDPDSSSTTVTTAADDPAAATDSSSTTVTTAAGDTPPPTETPSTDTTGTTATTVPKNTCEAPAVTREPAPEPGTTKNYLAGAAGDVDIERFNASELRILAATAATGWTAEIVGPSGPRVAVKFRDTADPKHLVKFSAALSSDGMEITVRVIDCRANDRAA